MAGNEDAIERQSDRGRERKIERESEQGKASVCVFVFVGGVAYDCVIDFINRKAKAKTKLKGVRAPCRLVRWC